MKKYEKINTGAEKIAKEIYGNTNDHMPSILSLVKWAEDSLNLKLKIDYTSLEKNHAGFVYFDPRGEMWRIWINSKDAECRQRFTICHEIAHIIKNSNAVFSFLKEDIYSSWGEERFCNRFAAAFLMPVDLFIKEWKKLRDDDILKKARIANFFGVSGDAVLYRAIELKLV